MNYAKPKIISLASASSVIQGSKQISMTKDSSLEFLLTVNAYESDE